MCSGCALMVTHHSPSKTPESFIFLTLFVQHQVYIHSCDCLVNSMWSQWERTTFHGILEMTLMKTKKVFSSTICWIQSSTRSESVHEKCSSKNLPPTQPGFCCKSMEGAFFLLDPAIIWGGYFMFRKAKDWSRLSPGYASGRVCVWVWCKVHVCMHVCVCVRMCVHVCRYLKT